MDDSGRPCYSESTSTNRVTVSKFLRKQFLRPICIESVYNATQVRICVHVA